MSSFEAAVIRAEEALATAERNADKKARVAALEECVKAYVEMPDAFEALNAAKSLLSAQKAMDNKKGQASALLTMGQMQLSLGNLDEALQHSEQALQLFELSGDTKAAEQANETMSQVLNKKGDVESAPNRQQGIAAIAELSRAIASGDQARFHASLDRCKRMSSVSDADIEDAMAEALEQDYLTAAKLFQDAMDMEGLMPETKGYVVDPRYHYMGCRTQGGLLYGPRFQCVKNAVCNIGRNETYAPVIMGEAEHDGWEYELAFNHGILDGVIQAPAGGMQIANQQKFAEEAFSRARATEAYNMGY